MAFHDDTENARLTYLLHAQLATLPSQISYATSLLISPQHERRTLIPRRALFDVRMQLMAEASPQSTATSNNDGHHAQPRDTNPTDTATLLSDSDITTSVYEGGFKSWEGAHDLARLVLERGPRKDLDDLARVDHVVELGCGTALPSLVLYQYALRNGLQIPFTLADYNVDVLRLVTLPNLLCVWAMECAAQAMSSGLPEDDGVDGVVNGEGDLEVTPELLEQFASDTETRGMPITFLSGPWSPALTKELVAPLSTEQSMLVLAAETIYSPASLEAFAEVLVSMLRAVRHGKALVAAKRVYFGVGGSVDAFKEEASRRGALCGEVQNSGIQGCDRSATFRQVGSSGVERCLLEVQIF